MKNGIKSVEHNFFPGAKHWLLSKKLTKKILVSRGKTFANGVMRHLCNFAPLCNFCTTL